MCNEFYQPYPRICLRPSLTYITLLYAPIGLLVLLFIEIGCKGQFEGHQVFQVFALLGALLSTLGIISLRATSYVITSEQLIVKKGILSRTTHYIELYRVVDYERKQNLPQLLVGVETVIIHSRDRSNSCLKMKGIKTAKEIVDEIRRRVEFNKRRKGIYEITN